MSHVERIHSVMISATERFGQSRNSLAALWRRLSLTIQFTIVAAIVVSITMAVLGRWVAERIESGVIKNTAASAALYLDRFVEPHLQGLAKGDSLGPASQKALADIVETKGFSQHVIAIKIWRPDGTILYSNDTSLIGKQLPVSGSLAKALQGTVAPEFNNMSDDENASERGLQLPLLEIYSPIRETNTTRIIAVAEFYQLANALADELAWARIESFAVVGGLSLLLLGALIGIVRRGSQTIVSQQQTLNHRIADLSKSLALNQELRQRVADANRRASESNERFLRRVGAELHDGPVQLIGLVLLRLDEILTMVIPKKADRASETVGVLRGALKEALVEIRALSHGLALPELENLSLAETADLAITNHERRSETSVYADFSESLPDVPSSIQTCVYRFVQEGLNNAYRHAQGKGQSVRLDWNGRDLEIEVTDEGDGFAGTVRSCSKSGIGLMGLRDRIESLGGTMIIDSAGNRGTRLRARFRLTEDEVANG